MDTCYICQCDLDPDQPRVWVETLGSFKHETVEACIKAIETLTQGVV